MIFVMHNQLEAIVASVTRSISKSITSLRPRKSQKMVQKK